MVFRKGEGGRQGMMYKWVVERQGKGYTYRMVFRKGEGGRQGMKYEWVVERERKGI